MNFFEKINSKISILFLVLVLFISFSLMLWSSLQESATMDELAHIPAGYGYVKFLDYRLNPEHPPLLKAIAALPLLFLNLNFPLGSDFWQKYINGQWDVGREFLYESGNDADLILQWSRIGPMLLTLLLAFLIYVWAKNLVGRWWAILPVLLFSLSPNVLAHGHLVTTDIASALGVVLGTYFFIQFLYEPKNKNLIYAGISFGIAQLLKFSNFMLIFYFLFLAIVFWWANYKKIQSIYPLKLLVKTIFRVVLIFLIGYILVVYPIYILFTWNYPLEKQVSDTKFILTSFAGGPPKQGEFCNPIRCLAELDIWLAQNYITRPLAQYFLGVLMVMQRGAGGNNAYFLGEVSAAGWRIYFPTVFVLKETIPFLIMLVLALGIWFKNLILNFKNGFVFAWQKFINYLNIDFDKFAMIVFVIFYWALSISSPLNIGFRHIIPTLPFIYILTIFSLKSWVYNFSFSKQGWMGMVINQIAYYFRFLFKHILILFLILWFVLEIILAAPYFLSYFNELAGGIWNGYKYVVDSNYDWGQDLLRLKKFVRENNIQKIAVDYFGGGNPKYYLGDRVEYWWSARGNPYNNGINWFAVSINTLQGAMGRPAIGYERNKVDEYQWLQRLRPPQPGWGEVPQPDFRIGTSIFVYNLANH